MSRGDGSSARLCGPSACQCALRWPCATGSPACCSSPQAAPSPEQASRTKHRALSRDPAIRCTIAPLRRSRCSPHSLRCHRSDLAWTLYSEEQALEGRRFIHLFAPGPSTLLPHTPRPGRYDALRCLSLLIARQSWTWRGRDGWSPARSHQRAGRLTPALSCHLLQRLRGTWSSAWTRGLYASTADSRCRPAPLGDRRTLHPARLSAPCPRTSQLVSWRPRTHTRAHP